MYIICRARKEQARVRVAETANTDNFLLLARDIQHDRKVHNVHHPIKGRGHAEAREEESLCNLTLPRLELSYQMRWLGNHIMRGVDPQFQKFKIEE